MAELDPDDVAAALQQIRLDRDQMLRREYDRSLPFADGLFDRWERAHRLGFGDESSIYDSAVVMGDVQVGRGAWIGPYTVLDGSGGPLVIGDYCSISAGVHIYTHDTVRWSLSLGAAPRHTAAVSIGHGCHLGAQTVVAAGAAVGDQCVIGANSFVKGALPDRAVAVGSPAVIVGRVTGEGESVQVEIGPDAVDALREAQAQE